MIGRILTIAGSDSGSGAGIQADIKTAMALGCYASTAITAVTVQNTQSVNDIYAIPKGVVAAQVDTIVEDIGADVIKTGMLYSADIVEMVAHKIRHYGIPAIIDPVMVATSGDRLLSDDMVSSVKEWLLPVAYLITPNIPEAQILTGTEIKSRDDMLCAARMLQSFGAKNVLLKGGHLECDEIGDVLVIDTDVHMFTHAKRKIVAVHGTGCTLASAIACGVAKGKPLFESVSDGIDYVVNAIDRSIALGEGANVLKH